MNITSYIGMHTPLCIFVPCDTALQAQQACTNQGKAGCSDVVVCVTGQGYAKSKDGLELHMATNYLGPFLLTMLLLPSLHRSASKVSNPLASLHQQTM